MLRNIENNLGYVTDEVSSVPAIEANSSNENRIKFVTDLASISRGKTESNNPEVRFKQLLEEAAPNGFNAGINPSTGGISVTYHKHASRPLEFCPVILPYDQLVELAKDSAYLPVDEEFDTALHNLVLKFSFLTYNGNVKYVQTNLRALLNIGIPLDKIPYNSKEDFIGDAGLPIFRAFKIKAPMFVFNQMMTHTQFSKEARSERVTKLDSSNYWLPSDLAERAQTKLDNPDPFKQNLKTIIEVLANGDKEESLRMLLTVVSQSEAQEVFQALGYKREIYQRAMLEFRYKEWLMVGYVNPVAWPHFFLERNAMPDIYKNWTQPEAAATATAMLKVFIGEHDVNP